MTDNPLYHEREMPVLPPLRDYDREFELEMLELALGDALLPTNLTPEVTPPDMDDTRNLPQGDTK